VTAGQVWRQRSGTRLVEIQADPMDPSGWRVVVPLDELGDAPHAPPLVLTVGHQRARVHLLTTVHADELGSPDGELAPEEVAALREAVRRLVGD
jgi:hypothetical protein